MRRALVVLVLLPLLVGLAPFVGAQDAPRRPDVVVVVLDDMRASDWQALPATRRLLAGGTWYGNFVLTTPACCPSRATLLTGRYAHNHRALLNEGKRGGWAAFHRHHNEGRTVAVALDRVGYRTSLVGKYLNNFPDDARVPHGWDRFTGGDDFRYSRDTVNIDGRPRQTTGYTTDWLRNRAVAFVGSVPAAEPLFLWFAPRAPHEPAIAADRHRGAFAGATTGSGRVADDLERRRLASLLAADEAVAAIAARMGPRWETACVLVMSDNGFLMDRGLAYKSLPWDGSVRVPMLARCPGLPAGDDDRLAASIDVAPTIARAAGAAMPAAVDGRALQDGWDREGVLVEAWGWNLYDRTGMRPDDPVRGLTWAGVRTRDRLYVERSDGWRGLYDRRNDPGERENLLDAGGGSPAEATDLKARLDALRRCAGNGCRAADGGG